MLCSILNKTNIYQSKYEKNVIVKLNFQLSNSIQHKYKCSLCLFTFTTFQLSIVRDLSSANFLSTAHAQRENLNYA